MSILLVVLMLLGMASAFHVNRLASMRRQFSVRMSDSSKLKREAFELEYSMREEARSKSVPEDMINKLIPLRAAKEGTVDDIDCFDGLLFDCDGVIAETERDAHRVTFNQAFREKNLPAEVEWSVEEYRELLKIGGGKERMTHYFNLNNNWPTSVAEADRVEFIKELHKLKTSLFQSAVESGIVPLRPGVQRLIDDALANNIKVAVCSTSNVDAVTTIVKTLLGEERLAKMPIYAGDMVANKKPAPDVYNLAAKELNLDPKRCWVIEDSGIGLQSAKAAGMNCCVTMSVYTLDGDFSASDVCVNDLDSGLDGPISAKYLNYKASDRMFKKPKYTENADLFSAASPTDKFVDMMKTGKMPGSPMG